MEDFNMSTGDFGEDTEEEVVQNPVPGVKNITVRNKSKYDAVQNSMDDSHEALDSTVSSSFVYHDCYSNFRTPEDTTKRFSTDSGQNNVNISGIEKLQTPANAKYRMPLSKITSRESYIDLITPEIKSKSTMDTNLSKHNKQLFTNEEEFTVSDEESSLTEDDDVQTEYDTEFTVPKNPIPTCIANKKRSLFLSEDECSDSNTSDIYFNRSEKRISSSLRDRSNMQPEHLLSDVPIEFDDDNDAQLALDYNNLIHSNISTINTNLLNVERSVVLSESQEALKMHTSNLLQTSNKSADDMGSGMPFNVEICESSDKNVTDTFKQSVVSENKCSERDCKLVNNSKIFSASKSLPTSTPFKILQNVRLVSKSLLDNSEQQLLDDNLIIVEGHNLNFSKEEASSTGELFQTNINTNIDTSSNLKELMASQIMVSNEVSLPLQNTDSGNLEEELPDSEVSDSTEKILSDKSSVVDEKSDVEKNSECDESFNLNLPKNSESSVVNAKERKSIDESFTITEACENDLIIFDTPVNEKLRVKYVVEQQTLEEISQNKSDLETTNRSVVASALIESYKNDDIISSSLQVNTTLENATINESDAKYLTSTPKPQKSCKGDFGKVGQQMEALQKSLENDLQNASGVKDLKSNYSSVAVITPREHCELSKSSICNVSQDGNFKENPEYQKESESTPNAPGHVNESFKIPETPKLSDNDSSNLGEHDQDIQKTSLTLEFSNNESSYIEDDKQLQESTENNLINLSESDCLTGLSESIDNKSFTVNEDHDSTLMVQKSTKKSLKVMKVPKYNLTSFKDKKVRFKSKRSAGKKVKFIKNQTFTSNESPTKEITNLNKSQGIQLTKNHVEDSPVIQPLRKSSRTIKTPKKYLIIDNEANPVQILSESRDYNPEPKSSTKKQTSIKKSSSKLSKASDSTIDFDEFTKTPNKDSNSMAEETKINIKDKQDFEMIVEQRSTNDAAVIDTLVKSRKQRRTTTFIDDFNVELSTKDIPCNAFEISKENLNDAVEMKNESSVDQKSFENANIEITSYQKQFEMPKNLDLDETPRNKSTRKLSNRKISTTKTTSINLENVDAVESLSETANVNLNSSNQFVETLNELTSKTPKSKLTDVHNLKSLEEQFALQTPSDFDLSKIPGFAEIFRSYEKRSMSVKRTPLSKTSLQQNKKQDSKNHLSDIKGGKGLLNTPQVRKSPSNDLGDLSGVKRLLKTPLVQTSRTKNLNDSHGIKKLSKSSKNTQNSLKNDLSDLKGGKRLLKTPRERKSPLNALNNFSGVKRLLKTPLRRKLPSNDLSDLSGVKKLLKTPLVQMSCTKNLNDSFKKTRNSPKNDLSNLKGVKQLLKTPRERKSPLNDLNDLSRVKRLLKTPHVQRSYTNNLRNSHGIKRLRKTSKKEQTSPGNDLDNLKGMKQLLTTPRGKKSPLNDLSDISGVKRLLKTPLVQTSHTENLNDSRGIKLKASKKQQNSPKNDLTNIVGVKQLFNTPRITKSPLNDLSDFRGIKILLKTPIVRKSHTNDFRGIKRLLRTPDRKQNSPKNDFRNIKGIKQLMETPRMQKSPLNDLSDVGGVKKLLKTPLNQKLPENNLSDVRGVKKLFASTKKQKSPENDLSNVVGIKKLFTMPKSQTNNCYSNDDGIAEKSFDELVKKKYVKTYPGKSSPSKSVSPSHKSYPLKSYAIETSPYVKQWIENVSMENNETLIKQAKKSKKYLKKDESEIITNRRILIINLERLPLAKVCSPQSKKVVNQSQRSKTTSTIEKRVTRKQAAKINVKNNFNINNENGPTEISRDNATCFTQNDSHKSQAKNASKILAKRIKQPRISGKKLEEKKNTNDKSLALHKISTRNKKFKNDIERTIDLAIDEPLKKKRKTKTVEQHKDFVYSPLTKRTRSVKQKQSIEVPHTETTLQKDIEIKETTKVQKSKRGKAPLVPTTRITRSQTKVQLY